jgi:putative restriction endonuclease
MNSPIFGLLNQAEWDRPFFKVLAQNDTGAAAGHQGGVVVPIELRRYFPSLDEGATSAENPTTDRLLNVELHNDVSFLREAVVRYQFQTWGGKRKPESRLTDNLGPLRNAAMGGDILVMQRKGDEFRRYRLVLVRQRTKAYDALAPLINGRRWGALNADLGPVTQDAVVAIRDEIVGHTDSAFEVVLPVVKRVLVTTNRAVRDVLFRKLVREEYANQCAFSGLAIRSPKNAFEVEAAHVVPLPNGGSDDVRNGLALSQTVHWAFDRGLIGVEPTSRRIYVPKQTRSLTGNQFLVNLGGRNLTEATRIERRVHKDALAWHWETLVKQWE